MPQKFARCSLNIKIKSRAGTEVESLSGCLWLHIHSATALLQVFNIPLWNHCCFSSSVRGRFRGFISVPSALWVTAGGCTSRKPWDWKMEGKSWAKACRIESMSNQFPEDQNEGWCCHLFGMSSHRMFIDRVKLSTANFTTHMPHFVF